MVVCVFETIKRKLQLTCMKQEEQERKIVKKNSKVSRDFFFVNGQTKQQ